MPLLSFTSLLADLAAVVGLVWFLVLLYLAAALWQ